MLWYWGPGSLAAALAAARSGVKVTLLERFGCFGGNITTVGVEGMAWYRHDKKRLRPTVSGVNLRSVHMPRGQPYLNHNPIPMKSMPKASRRLQIA